MSRLLRLTTALFCTTMLLPWGAHAEEFPADWHAATLRGTLQFEMASRHTGARYVIQVGLPHAPAPVGGYPVLWMLDGNASYPLTSFVRPHADDTRQGSRREAPRTSRPAGVIVAIASANDSPFDVDGRARDYTPVPDAATGDRLSPRFGGAAAFRQFLVEELRPRIAQQFPLNSLANTLFGFSYGGLFTVDTLLTDSRHFQRYWAASPSLWFSDALLARRLASSAQINAGAGTKVVLTVGEDEQYPATPVPAARQEHLNQRAIVDHVRRAGAALAAANPDASVTTVVARDHDHFDMLMHGTRRVVEFAFAP